MKNVDFKIAEGVTLQVRYLRGKSVATRTGQPVALDDKNSFVIHIEEAETELAYSDLSRLLNDYVFAYDGAPIKGLKVAREEDEDQLDQIELKGRLKALGVPFEIEGRPEVTRDGRIRIRTTAIQALDLEVSGLMDLLGLESKDLIGDLEDRGVRVDGNDVILSPDRALPPPVVKGRLSAVEVAPDHMLLRFGPRRAVQTADGAKSSNYLFFRKGMIRIGRMTMTDADLRIIDQDPDDPFDFSVDALTQQLIAGYAKLTEDGGLRMYIPDFADMRRARGSPTP